MIYVLITIKLTFTTKGVLNVGATASVCLSVADAAVDTVMPVFDRMLCSDSFSATNTSSGCELLESGLGHWG